MTIEEAIAAVRVASEFTLDKKDEPPHYYTGARHESEKLGPIIESLLQVIHSQYLALEKCAYYMNKPNFITHDELIQACGDGSYLAFGTIASSLEALKKLGEK